MLAYETLRMNEYKIIQSIIVNKKLIVKISAIKYKININK